MSKIILLPFILMMVCVAVASSQEQNQSVEVIIHQEIRGPSPRSISIVPIICTYNFGAISLHFMEDIGSVSIIVNQSTGEQYLDYVDSSEGSTEIAVSGAEGDYVIQLETETGVNYYGYFSL